MMPKTELFVYSMSNYEGEEFFVISPNLFSAYAALIKTKKKQIHIFGNSVVRTPLYLYGPSFGNDPQNEFQHFETFAANHVAIFIDDDQNKFYVLFRIKNLGIHPKIPDTHNIMPISAVVLRLDLAGVLEKHFFE